jgi:hypothetical protein
MSAAVWPVRASADKGDILIGRLVLAGLRGAAPRSSFDPDGTRADLSQAIAQFRAMGSYISLGSRLDDEWRRFDDLITVTTILEAARRLGNRSAEGVVLTNLGTRCSRLAVRGSGHFLP